MLTDRTTKLLLALIAIALWANLLTPVTQAQDSVAMFELTSKVGNIESYLKRISIGTCSNSRLC